MQIICLDLEGVLVPEIWINVAESTGIPALRRTTREEPDYDRLMKARIEILDRHKLGLADIQKVISQMGPLEGAREFLDSLRETYQVVILSDTFYEFAEPLMKQLALPTLFCHHLAVAETGQITGYKLRIDDPKRKAVRAFRDLNFSVIAAGDSYNDTAMLSEAHAGILFRAPKSVMQEFPQFPTAVEYAQLRTEVDAAAKRISLKKE